MSSSVNSSLLNEVPRPDSLYRRPSKRQKTLFIPSIPIMPVGQVAKSPLRRGVTHDRHPQSRLAPVARFIFPPSQSAAQRVVVPIVLEQTGKIKMWMQSRTLDVEVVSAIDEKIEAIYDEQSYDTARKLVELGLLYYYLTRDATVPDETSLLEKRIAEITQRVKDLQCSHEQFCPKDLIDLIPSGSISYLMRAFTWMIFTPDGQFNKGGCYAVKAILNSPVSLFMSEDRRTQILMITNRLIDDLSFQDKFMQPFDVHEDLHELIRIDLKLPVDEEMVFLYVRWDLLNTLFSIIGQTNNDENCYAIAMMSNLLGGHPDAVLDLLKEVLPKGYFYFYGEKIPVLSVLDDRCRYEADFASYLPNKSAIQLTGVLLARQSLGADIKYVAHEEYLPLGQVIKAQFDEQAYYAKKIYLSLKQSLLSQMFLKILQFVAVNSHKTEKIRGLNAFSGRREILNKLYDRTICTFKQPVTACSSTQSFVDRLRALWLQRLFFLDCRNDVQEIRNDVQEILQGRMSIDEHSQSSGRRSFLSMRRLCFLQEGALHPIDLLTDLTTYLCQLVDEAYCGDEQYPRADWIEKLKEHLQSEFVAQKIAQTIQEGNRRELNVPWGAYCDANAFFLLQKGGSPGLIMLWDRLNCRFAPSLLISFNNINDFFTKFCYQVRNFQARKPDFFTRGGDPQILALTLRHAFNLNPLHFKSFWNTPDEPAVQLKKRVVAPGEALRRKRPCVDLKKRILREAFGEEHVESVYSRISQKRINIAHFRREVFSVINRERFNEFDEALNRVLTEIHFETFRENLFQIAERLEVKLSNSQYESIIDYINHARADKNIFSTGELMILVQRALVESGCPFFSYHEIEDALCSQLSLPLVIDLGNLNWIKQLKEHLRHARLIMRYDIAKQRFCCRVREIGVDTYKCTDGLMQGIGNGIDVYFEE